MLDQLIQVLTNPQVLKALAAYWVFSAFVGHLPSPQEVSDVLGKPSPIGLLIYRMIFGILHSIGGNLDRAAVALKVPGAVADEKADAAKQG